MTSNEAFPLYSILIKVYFKANNFGEFFIFSVASSLYCLHYILSLNASNSGIMNVLKYV